MKKETLINNLIIIPIIILIVLVLYKTTFKNVSITDDSKINQIEEFEEVSETKDDNEQKDIELSREEAYKELISYNKIYNWMYMFVKDKNYEPAKRYEYKNPELRITSDAIKLNSTVYDVINFKVIKSYNKDELISTIFKFELINGEASFYHSHDIKSRSSYMQENKEYYFELIDNLSSINVYCANQAPIQFHF